MCNAVVQREYPVLWHGYRDLVKIGEGAHSVVYRAKCCEETVAIKVIDLEKASAGFEMIDLDRLRGLDNVNILVPYTIFTVKRSMWIVMPYMAGGSLRSITTNYIHDLPVVSIGHVLSGLLNALLHLQNKDAIFHNDVNVSNILIDSPNAEIKLSDYGLSYHSYHDRPPSSTPAYWHAPDIEVNGPCNVWSFGVAVLELAHGYPPLCHLKSFNTLKKNEFTIKFRNFVSGCLRSDARERPTLMELADDPFIRSNNYNDVLKDFMAGAGLRPLEEVKMERADYNDRYVIKWEFDEPLFGLKPTYGDPVPAAAAGRAWAALENVVLSLKQDVEEMRSRADSMEMGLSLLYSLATGGSKLH